MITATFAADQGREVFAVPGNIHAPQSTGTNRLIQDGARPLLTCMRSSASLNLTGRGRPPTQAAACRRDATESRLLDVLGMKPCMPTKSQAKSGMPIGTVSAALTIMELKGLVRQAGGMTYSLVRESIARIRSAENGT